MNIKYDIEKLDRIIQDFYNITGIAITITDTNFKVISQLTHNRYEFCKTLQAYNPELCMASDRKLLKKCTQNKCVAFHECFAGLWDAALPIIIKNEIAGYILMGQIRRFPDFSTLSERFPDCLIPELEKHFQTLPLYNRSQLESALRIVGAVVTKIMEEKMIVVDAQELSLLVGEYIEENLSNNLSVDKLCLYFNISKNRLYHSFRTCYNTTVGEYIQLRRIEKAKELLGDVSLSVDEVAQSCGFSDVTYFYKVFKKLTQKTPGEYRESSH